MRNFLVFLLSVFLVQSAVAQSYPKDYFRSPLDIPLYLSGTFGELRSNHFHSGIDIKTQGVQGKKVYAIADGFVSRIKVSEGGYGKTLYITHPNGYVSVYGHLREYNDTLQKFVKELQYKNKKFSVESFPNRDRFKVKKGDLIAFSGNTGGSQGPHLHFEIREEATQYPLNPLLFESIKIKDFTRPQILGLAIYPVDESSLINGKNDTAFYVVEGWGENHRIKNKPKITLSGNISFGIKTYDRMNEINNKNGVYEIALKIDSSQVFGMKMNKLSFSTTRYINSCIDYRKYKNDGGRYIRSTIDTNNRLFIYNNVENNGIYNFSDTLIHDIEYVVNDAYKNSSLLKFEVESKIDTTKAIPKKKKIYQHFALSKNNKMEDGNISLNFPAFCFYGSLDFHFKVKQKKQGELSDTYYVHDRFVPVQKFFSISIKADSIPDDLMTKTYISYSPEGDNFYYTSTKRSGEYLTAKVRLLGVYKLALDTIPPKIKALNIKDSKNISAQKNIRIKIDDKETSIKSYNAFLNDKWILMEYEPKNSLIVYNYDELLKKGDNNFYLEVTDAMGNKTEYRAKLSY